MKFRNIIASALILCILLTTITPAFDEKAKAAEDVDITKSEIIKSAAEYLISSKNSDNSIGYSGLINDTAEAVSVLEKFIDADKFNSDIIDSNTIDSDIADSLGWINDYNKTNNDEIARSVIANGNSDDLTALFKSQNTDGGFGLTDKYESDIFDSILVLEAVNSLGKEDRSNPTWHLVNYIARQMNKNGSFSYTKNSDESPALTAMALYVVSKYMHDNGIKSDLTTDMINKSSAYLQNISKNVSNNISNDVSKNSYDKENIEASLYINLALQEAGLFELKEDTINALKNVQKKDGSFYGDVHLTSLAIWLLGKIEDEKSVNIVDLKVSNTQQAYYGVETEINVAYNISYEAKMGKDYSIGCVIKNGNDTIYESDKMPVKLTMGQSNYSGSFDDVKIKQDKDNGIKVYVTLYDRDEIVKKSEGSITLENQPRAGETDITDFTLNISNYTVFADDPKDIIASYKLLYTTNVDNTVDMVVTLTKDGVVLKEEKYTEELRPDKDSVQRDALTFMPDTTSEGKYTITARCIYKGEQLMQYTANVNTVIIPSGTEDDVHTITEPVNTHVPFTVKWIGPRLSDYIMYAGKTQDVTGEVGISCYGDDDFSGKVIAEVMFEDEQIALVEKEISISKGEKNITVEDMVDFEASELGDYTVTASLYDKENNKIISGSKTVKIVEKKRLELIANSNISETESRTVDINWNDISNSEDTYNYRLYRRHGDNDWKPRSIWNENDKIKVLNVYPNRPLLEKWMTETISETEHPAGMGMFDIDSVKWDAFNDDPEKYMLDGNKWKYDVVFHGSWDCGCNLSQKAYEVTQAFVDSGRGVLFGHDTIACAVGHDQFNKFADQLGILLDRGPGPDNCSVYVSVMKIGTLTNFPWTIRGTLKVPQTHTSGQYAGGTLAGTEWMRIDSRPVIDEETQSQANFYLVTNNNLGMIQTGHSNGQATDDERKVLANTLFYLHQISQVTTAKDNSFYDLAAPDSPEVRLEGVDDSKFSFDLISKDNGTVYQYYIAAMSSMDKDEADVKSNVLSHTALSGLKGYVYAVNNNPNEDDSILEYDENNEHILNIAEANEDGSLDIDVDVTKYDAKGGLYLHVFAVDNEDNVSCEVIKSLDEGAPSPHIETDKNEYTIGDTVTVTSSTSVMPYSVTGDVSISLYDENDRFIKELYSKNNQAISVDEPFTTEHKIVTDESYLGTYKIKLEWKTSDNEVYTAVAEFKVAAPVVVSEDDNKVEVIHTETNPVKETPKTPSAAATNQSTSKQDKPVSDRTPRKSNDPTGSTTEDPDVTTQADTQTTTEITTELTTQATTQTITTEATTSNPSSISDDTRNRTPNTGDEVNLILLISIMSLSLVASIFIYKKRKI